MSRPAMTSGLEWTVKVTAQDMPHVLDRFSAEFETYWSKESFIPFAPDDPERFRHAIQSSRQRGEPDAPRFFADLKPHPFQERVLEALEAERQAGSRRNLVVAATGTGKTVMAAFDFARWKRNRSAGADLREIIEWRLSEHPFPTRPIDLASPCFLQLHAAYGLREITAAFGKATLQTTGPAGTGVVHVEEKRTYLHLVTFRKEERDFAPATRYRDYPISPTKLHWESQSDATRHGSAGQNYLHFHERGYQILFFARLDKRICGETAPFPFLFLGPARSLLSCESERPLKMVWELERPMPWELYKQARTV